MRILDDCLTYQMAMDLLDIPYEQNTRLYRILNTDPGLGNTVETKHVGKMKFIDRHGFEKATGVSTENARFPAYIAAMPLDDMITAAEAAEMMNMTERNIRNLGYSMVLETVELKPWGGYTLYSKRSVAHEINRRNFLAKALERKRTPRGKKNGT